MLEVIFAGGWLMVPIGLCSVLALAIVINRSVALAVSRVIPSDVPLHAKALLKLDGSSAEQDLASLKNGSALGEVLATVIEHRHRDEKTWRGLVEDRGREVVHRLERYLDTLGTIAGITPLLGLLGTVIGMIKVFYAIELHGVGQPGMLAGGISEALVTTATGLSVAIPSYFFYRFFTSRVKALALMLEQNANALIEAIKQQ